MASLVFGILDLHKPSHHSVVIGGLPYLTARPPKGLGQKTQSKLIKVSHIPKGRGR